MSPAKDEILYFVLFASHDWQGPNPKQFSAGLINKKEFSYIVDETEVNIGDDIDRIKLVRYVKVKSGFLPKYCYIISIMIADCGELHAAVSDKSLQKLKNMISDIEEMGEREASVTRMHWKSVYSKKMREGIIACAHM